MSRHRASPPARGDEREVFALTLWAEAGQYPVRAIEALAALVMNRVHTDPPRWGRGVREVCRAPFHFPCWNPHHPRHRRLLASGAADPVLAICRRIAARALAGSLADPTGGATHFHPAAELPPWAIGCAPITEIGGLCFYRPEDLGCATWADATAAAARRAAR